MFDFITNHFKKDKELKICKNCNYYKTQAENPSGDPPQIPNEGCTHPKYADCHWDHRTGETTVKANYYCPGNYGGKCQYYVGK